jgi:hypothetical protein
VAALCTRILTGPALPLPLKCVTDPGGVDFDEDQSQVRTHSGPRIMASLRNLVITILRLADAAGIAAALRYHARRPCRPLQTIMKC